MSDTPTTNPHTAPRRRGMSAGTITRAIKRRHGTLTRFCEAIGRNRFYVADVIHGRETSSPVARAIADVVGREPHEIWPRLYAEDGGPLSTQYRRAS